MIRHRKIVIAVGGASGAIYGKILLEKLTTMSDQYDDIGVIMTENAKENWRLEIGDDSYNAIDLPFYEPKDFSAPFASGSAQFRIMIVCPCSMGLLARIAQGVSNDLITRAADVMLKERGKLILVPRETPYNLIHIQNMKTLTEAGAIIAPASPSYYSRPAGVQEIAATVVDRILDLAGLEVDSFRWGSDGELK